MPVYQGACTGAMLDKAGELATKYGNFELGRATIKITSSSPIPTTSVDFKNDHTNPRIFLQVYDPSAITPGSKSILLKATVSRITSSGFIIGLTTSRFNGDTSSGNSLYVPSGTYYVDYFVIDEG